jgi:hypothetical protein
MGGEFSGSHTGAVGLRDERARRVRILFRKGRPDIVLSGVIGFDALEGPGGITILVVDDGLPGSGPFFRLSDVAEILREDA